MFGTPMASFIKYLKNTFQNICSAVFTNFLSRKFIILFYTRRT